MKRYDISWTTFIILFCLLVFICSQARADSVICGAGTPSGMLYSNVKNLTPISGNGFTYSFEYGNKRYIVSTTNCIIEFDK